MKKFVTSSLFVFWAVVVALLIAGLWFLNKSDNSNTQVPVNANQSQGQSQGQSQATPGSKSNTVSNTTSSTKITMAELAKHNSSTSCWTLISGQVYDVTSFVNKHPGGQQAILSTCGIDSTAGFNNQHGSSRSAKSVLASFYLGDLNQTINTPAASNIKTNSPASASASVKISGEIEDD